MNKAMNYSRSPFAPELNLSPRIVWVALVVISILIYFASERAAERATLLQFSFLTFMVAVAMWLVDERWPTLGAWFVTLALSGLIVVADLWLQVPGLLSLLVIPVVLAMIMIGLRALLVVSLLEITMLAVLMAQSMTQSAVVTSAEAGVMMATIATLSALLYLWHRQSMQLADWSWQHYQYAQSVLEQARDERLEHRQLEADLILANNELARLTAWLKTMHQLAEEMRQTKERFVANVSHELRTPLNMILGFSDIISHSSSVYGVNLPPALLADIAAIQRNSQHLAKLVDDVLDLSQIESDRMAINKEWSSMPEIVDQSVEAVQALYASKKLYLRSEVPDDLPLVYCDSTRIRQVLINLLSNAGRFTEQGGAVVTLTHEEGMILISVADTGLGIAPDDQKRLFEPFYQVDSSLRRSYGGSGLGLHISKQFVEMHQGKMWLESAPGVGTTFYISLPLPTPLPADFTKTDGIRYNPYAQFDGRIEQSKAPAPQLMARYVVLEEGNTLQRMFTRFREDVEVVAVQDMPSALHELSRSPAHALLINQASFLTLPAPRDPLTQLPYGTPVIACSVLDEKSSTPPTGAVRYLSKPVSSETLLATLDELGNELLNRAGDEGRTILIVDDEHELLQLFARMLSTAPRPYRVIQTTSGQRALSLLRERRPDLMLLDLMMPKMDGFEVLEKKGQDPAIAGIPTVVVSAKDPVGHAIVSHHLTVTYKDGISLYNLMSCIQAVSEALFPTLPTAGQAQSERQLL